MDKKARLSFLFACGKMGVLKAVPKIVPQEYKANSTLSLQPKNLEKNSVQLIMMYDIAGYGTNEIASALDMSISRISIIKSSPLYQEQRLRKFDELKERIVSGTAKQILEDPSRKILLDAKEDCAILKVDLALHSKNDYIRNAACSEILAIGGIIPLKSNDAKSQTTIVMEERIAKRFAFARDYIPSETVAERKVTITHD